MTGPRVTVLGAGVVGAACARHLADGGARVRVRDPGAGRVAASWAAAGILSPSHPERLPASVHVLADRSRALWDELGQLHPAVELRRTGLVLRGGAPEWLAWRRARGLAVEEVTWPGSGGDGGGAAHRFPEVAVVRSPRVAPALLGDLAVDRGPVPPLDVLRGEADVVVIATGAWAAPDLADAGLDLAVAPRRGQMLLFAWGDPGTVLMEGTREGVAVPRADGRVVAGTTLEDTGFAGGTVAGDLDRLEEWARAAVPRLGPREDAWAGLRPWSPRVVPVIDVLAPGVVAAVGHFRNGILLAPATGELVADLVLDRAPHVDPAPFRAGR